MSPSVGPALATSAGARCGGIGIASRRWPSHAVFTGRPSGGHRASRRRVRRHVTARRLRDDVPAHAVASRAGTRRRVGVGVVRRVPRPLAGASASTACSAPSWRLPTMGGAPVSCRRQLPGTGEGPAAPRLAGRARRRPRRRRAVGLRRLAGDRELLADADHAVWAKGARSRPCRERGAIDRVDAVRRGCCARRGPRQWIKNVLVFAAPGCGWCAGRLAGASGTPCWPSSRSASPPAVCTCGTTHSTWRPTGLHPTKRFRPVAAGVVSVRTAQVAGTVCDRAPSRSPPRHGPMEDRGRGGRLRGADDALQRVAQARRRARHRRHRFGFVLRAAAGAVAVAVPMSKWFVLCTVFGSLFIVTGKRYAELRELGGGAAAVRTTLGRVLGRVPAHRPDGVARCGAGQLLPVGVRDVGRPRPTSRSTSSRSSRC